MIKAEEEEKEAATEVEVEEEVAALSVSLLADDAVVRGEKGSDETGDMVRVSNNGNFASSCRASVLI